MIGFDNYLSSWQLDYIPYFFHNSNNINNVQIGMSVVFLNKGKKSGLKEYR